MTSAPDGTRGCHPKSNPPAVGGEVKLTRPAKAALLYLRAKDERHPNQRYGWHMPNQRTAACCRRTLEPKGLVSIERITPTHFRYRITEAGRLALQEVKPHAR